MKKLYFAAIAILLALAMVSCDNVGTPGTGLNEDGTVTLNLGTAGLGRALVGPTAEAGTTYLEASFRAVGGTPTDIIRTTWSWATIGKIKLVPGSYEVILFAGRGSDKTLLGVGRVDQVDIVDSDGQPDTPITITPPAVVPVTARTVGLHFTVEPLTNDISSDLATSTFFIGATQPTSGDAPYMRDEFGNNIPVFEVLKVTPTSGTWKFDIGSGNLATYASDIIISGAGQVLQTGHSSKDALDVPRQLTTLGPASPATSAVTGTFTFPIAAPDADGAVYVALEVPVVAFSAAPATVPVTWYIRGGLNNGLLDAGPSPSGGASGAPGILGGAIVVFFGNIDAIPELILYYDYDYAP